MSPLHTFLFMHTAPQFLEEGSKVLQGIGDLYVEKHQSYIRIYGLNDAPHFLPMFVSDRLLLKEIACQTCIRGIMASLTVISKRV
jgi:hypothetical protein